MQERRRVPRKPPPRRVASRGPETRTARIAGGAAVGGLLLVLIVVVVLIVGGGGDSSADGPRAAAGAAATPTPTATATPKPKPTPRPLSAGQRQARAMAAQLVDGKGFEVTRLRDFDPRKTLQVLIGRSSSGNELAFFFVDGEYIGNDSSESSRSIDVRRGGDATSAVLRYAVTGADPVDVTFRWDGTRLTPSPAIPPGSARG